MIKIIVTDLDDTLLRRDKTISSRTMTALDKCRKRGILLAFATSRSEAACKRFTDAVAPDVIISNGGALAKTGEKTLYKATVSPNDADGLISRFRSDNSVSEITLTAANGYFNTTPIDKSWAGWQDYAAAVQTDFSRPIDFGDVYKLTVQSDSPDAIAHIAADFPDVYALRFTGEDWYVFRNKRADKANALTAVCAALNVSVKEAAAFGDDLNDLEMLLAAGTGVAPSNAVPEVKSAADFICGDCDNDGPAKWLEAHVL